MEELQGIACLLAVLLPFVAGGAIALLPERAAEPWSYGAAVLTVGATVLVIPEVWNGGTVSFSMVEILPGLDLLLRVDAVGLTFGLLASVLWLVATLYSTGYVRAERMARRRRYFACFAASIGSAMGVAFSGNVLTFLVFYEILTLATYPLVVHHETEEAIRAGRRYLVFALSGGLAVTIAAAWTWNLAGTLDFVPGGFLHEHGTPAVREALFALFIIGCGVKAAVMPLHSWLPAAMVAPAPVSGLLHAVAVVKAGVFGCIRVLAFVFGKESLTGAEGPRVLLVFCAVTIIAGSLMALRQDNLKRRLAFSTIVHLSYIVLGAALVAPLGLTGSVLHLVNHGVAKITLFFCAGAIHATAHVENVSQLGGLGRRMPATFAAFTVASLALVGTPGLCGFLSKLFLVRGAVESGDLAYMAVLLVASLFTAAYLAPVVRVAFFDRRTGDHHGGDHHEDHADIGEPRASMLTAILITLAFVVSLGIVPWALSAQYRLAFAVAAAVFGGSS